MKNKTAGEIMKQEAWPKPGKKHVLLKFEASMH